MSEELRMCSKTDLIALARRAEKQHFNRRGDVAKLEADLDPDGVNILSIRLWGHNVDFAPILHHRIEVLAKVTGSPDPAKFYLDVADKDWKRLHVVPEKEDA